jgi:hypothetical protein
MMRGRATQPGPKDCHREIGSIIELGVLCSLLLMSSCGGSLFKVKPAGGLPALPDNTPSASAGSITVRAAPLMSDEESQELFESNLQLAGLLPVRIELSHSGDNPVELKKVRFRLVDKAGTRWKAVTMKQAIGRILKANDVYAYNPASRKTFEQEFRAYELDLKSSLTRGEGKRRGLIIFLTPEKAPVASPKGLVLTVEGLTNPVTVNLN